MFAVPVTLPVRFAVIVVALTLVANTVFVVTFAEAETDTVLTTFRSIVVEPTEIVFDVTLTEVTVFEICKAVEFANVLTVELPTENDAAVIITLAPTFAAGKLTTVELAVNELPTWNVSAFTVVALTFVANTVFVVTFAEALTITALTLPVRIPVTFAVTVVALTLVA